MNAVRPSARSLAVGAVVIALGLVVVRLYVDARAALVRGDEAARAGRFLDAVELYGESARLYVPVRGPGHHAVERLGTLADAAEVNGRWDDARRAWEAVRAAALGTRSFYTPYEAWLARANERLIDLYTRLDPDADAGPAARDARRAFYAARFASLPGPRVGFVFVALVGAGLCLAAVLAFIRRGLDAGLRLQKRAATVAGMTFLVGVVMFVLGLRGA